MKKKILHIHSDPKFVRGSLIFNHKKIENTIFYWGNELAENIKDSELIDSKFPYNKESIIKIAEECEKFDVVVIYSLMNFKIDLCLSLPKNIKVIWRFYGGEIYSREPKKILSQKSLFYLQKSKPKISIKYRIKSFVWKLIFKENKTLKAYNRVDYFLGLMDKEYELLRKWKYSLPPFVQFPFQYNEEIENFDLIKTKSIIFGNSKNIGNNHLDILELFSLVNLDSSLKIKMFFSYGEDNLYSKEVKKKASELKNIEIIETFLEKNEFNEIYKSASCLVFNGYRQMAMGNIWTAIKNGVKIYLSKKNITYHWLIDNGFIISSIEEKFKDDLIHNNYSLSTNEIEHNLKIFKLICKQYSLENFQTKFLNTIIK